MSHPVGEMLRCNECGAELVYTKACDCPEQERKAHMDMCCGKEMQSVGVTPKGKAVAAAAQGQAGPQSGAQAR